VTASSGFDNEDLLFLIALDAAILQVRNGLNEISAGVDKAQKLLTKVVNRAPDRDGPQVTFGQLPLGVDHDTD
jgi:hypothetical protein